MSHHIASEAHNISQILLNIVMYVWDYGFLLVIFGFLPALLSLPAIKELRKRSQWSALDYGINIFAIALWWYLNCANYPTTVSKGLGSLAMDPIAISLLSIIMNYARLLLPKKIPAWVICIGNIVLMIFAASLIYFFLPSFGE